MWMLERWHKWRNTWLGSDNLIWFIFSRSLSLSPTLTLTHSLMHTYTHSLTHTGVWRFGVWWCRQWVWNAEGGKVWSSAAVIIGVIIWLLWVAEHCMFLITVPSHFLNLITSLPHIDLYHLRTTIIVMTTSSIFGMGYRNETIEL